MVGVSRRDILLDADVSADWSECCFDIGGNL